MKLSLVLLFDDMVAICYYLLDFLEFYKTYGTIGFTVSIALLINILKGFSSKMTLEVAKIGLKGSTQYML